MKDLFKKHAFKLEETLFFEEDLVYKVKILPNSKSYKKQTWFPLGWIYIRKSDYAILEFEYTMVAKKSMREFYEKIHGSSIKSYLKLKFVDIDNKLYLKHMKYKSPKINRFQDIIDNEYNKSKNELYYFSEQELLISEIITDSEVVSNEYSEINNWNDNLFKKKALQQELLGKL